MPIVYQDTKDFAAAELEALFLSVQWNSGKFPDKLQLAMKNSHAVLSAWDGDKLVGLMNSISDGVMTAYFHYLLVHPEYQGQKIGAELVRRMLERYEGYITKLLISYDTQIPFYKRCGFTPSANSTPMYVTSIEL